MSVLQHGGLLAPLGMVVPELFAHVRKLEPGIDHDGVAVAGFDEGPQVAVAFGIRFIIMPGRHVQGRDAGSAPAGGEVIQIDAAAVGGIEKRPQIRRAKRRLHSQVGQSMQQVREALVAVFAGTHRDPEHGAGATAIAGDERRASPALAGKNARHFGNRKARQLQRLLPNDGQLGAPHIQHAPDRHVLFRRLKAEHLRHRRLAFEDHDRALLDPLRPAGGCRRLRADHEDAGQPRRQRTGSQPTPESAAMPPRPLKERRKSEGLCGGPGGTGRETGTPPNGEQARSVADGALVAVPTSFDGAGGQMKYAVFTTGVSSAGWTQTVRG